jgi:23S rRNA (uracil1939-C5)-methyltransferase
MSEKIVELEIEDLAYDGKAVARLDGKVVFVNGGLPGEKVRARIVRSKPRFSNAILLEVTEKCDLRVPAPCPHVSYCGGCTWQDLDYNTQLRFKQKQIVACLERIGNLKDPPVDSIVGAVELFHYRNKMEFSFNVSDDGGFTLGLHKRGRFDEVFDLQKCYLQPDVANRVVAHIREFVQRRGISVYDVRNHTGFMRFVVLRMAKRTAQMMVNIVTNLGDLPYQQELISELTGIFKEVTTIVHNQNGMKSNIAVGEIERVLYGTGFIEEKLFDYTFQIRANSFFQTNSLQTETLYRTTFDVLDPQHTDRAMDLYCGTGSIGLLLARHVSEVVGVELVPDAIQVANENAELNNVSNITFWEGDVKDFLRTEQATAEPFSVVVVDPPRAGLHPKALKRLLEINSPKIVYISCNPSTFARDAAALVAAGYRLEQVTPVDMFPHTMHIELVSRFQRDESIKLADHDNSNV